MENPINYSLSYYFDELKRREQEKSEQSMTKGLSEGLSINNGIKVLKALKEAQNHTLSLMTLARSVNLKILPCQEICNELEKEKLIEVEPDNEMGNDQITLTGEGVKLI